MLCVITVDGRKYKPHTDVVPCTECCVVLCCRIHMTRCRSWPVIAIITGSFVRQRNTGTLTWDCDDKLPNSCWEFVKAEPILVQWLLLRAFHDIGFIFFCVCLKHGLAHCPYPWFVILLFLPLCWNLVTFAPRTCWFEMGTHALVSQCRIAKI